MSKKRNVPKNEKAAYLLTSETGVPFVGTTSNWGHSKAQHQYAIRSGKGAGAKFTGYYQCNNYDQATVKFYKPRGKNKEEKIQKKKAQWIRENDSVRKGLNSRQ